MNDGEGQAAPGRRGPQRSDTTLPPRSRMGKARDQRYRLIVAEDLPLTPGLEYE